MAGVVSSLGFLVSPIAFEASRTLEAFLDTCDFALVQQTVTQLQEATTAVVLQAGVQKHEIQHEFLCTMSYQGQGYELDVTLPDGVIRRGDRAAIRSAFEEQYWRLYGQRLPGLSCAAPGRGGSARSGPTPSVSLEAKGGNGAAFKTVRDIYLPHTGGMAPVRVYDRYSLASDDQLTGPAIIEEKESTVVLLGPCRAQVDADGSIVVEREV